MFTFKVKAPPTTLGCSFVMTPMVCFPVRSSPFLSNQLLCRSTSAATQTIVQPTGVHPTAGPGLEWIPKRNTVSPGTIVTRRWNSSTLVTAFRYRIQQILDVFSTEPLTDGFDSGSATSIEVVFIHLLIVDRLGSFSYQFNTLGTFYYWSPNVDNQNLYIRGTIDVVESQSQLLTMEFSSNQTQGRFSAELFPIMSCSSVAQTCLFPFTFESINYTNCTSVNDTQPWCSPTSMYTGQRIYCTPTSMARSMFFTIST